MHSATLRGAYNIKEINWNQKWKSIWETKRSSLHLPQNLYQFLEEVEIKNVRFETRGKKKRGYKFVEAQIGNKLILLEHVTVLRDKETSKPYLDEWRFYVEQEKKEYVREKFALNEKETKLFSSLIESFIPKIEKNDWKDVFENKEISERKRRKKRRIYL